MKKRKDKALASATVSDADINADGFSSGKFEVAELSGRQVAAAMLRDVKPIVPLLLLCLVIAVAAATVVSFAPMYTGEIVDIINARATGSGFDSERLVVCTVVLACLYVGYALFTILKTYMLNNVMSRHFNNKLRIRMSEKIMRLPVAYVDRTSKGELIERMTDDVSVIGSIVHQLVDTFVSGVFQLVLIIVLAFLQDPFMALAVVGIGVVSVAGAAIISSRASKHFNRYMAQNGKLYSVVEETYSGIKTVRAYGMERFMRDNHARLNGGIRESGKRGYFISGVLEPLMMLVVMLSYALICLIGGARIASGATAGVGAIVATVMYAGQLGGPLGAIAGSMGMLQRARTSAKRIYGMLALPEVEPCEAKCALACDTVEFENVRFGYSPDKPVIKDLSLRVERGQKIAIVGPTGGGKTTIVNLLMRFYDPDDGRILIDGTDTKTLSRECVRDNIVMVLQDTWLFGGTVAENVAYGVENATREEVEHACRAAYCDGFISALPNGYDTEITHGAANISQGQKQLLTIARAFMTDRPILVLDEATSNVDTRTESLLQRAMDKLMSDKTCFVIAHRLSTIINADKILVINDGRVIESGTHTELMSAGGFYADMFNSQYSIA